jgi:hypothetical protein
VGRESKGGGKPKQQTMYTHVSKCKKDKIKEKFSSSGNSFLGQQSPDATEL